MAHHRRPRKLFTVHDIVATLGGLDGVQELTGIGRTSIHNWVAENTIPPKWFKVMNDALVALGYHASPALWGQCGNHDRVPAPVPDDTHAA